MTVSVGFDTASSIALLAISALARKRADGSPIPSVYIVILPASLANLPHFGAQVRLVLIHCWHDSRRLLGFDSSALLILKFPGKILCLVRETFRNSR